MDKPEDIEAKAWNCSEYPDWLRAMVEAANEVADRLGMSTEQIVSWAILSAQSQAYIDAARIAEEVGIPLATHKGMCGKEMIPVKISAAILQRKEEIGR